MDPEATLRDLREALDDGAFSEAVELLNSYYQWRVRGGFAPSGGDSRADDMANELVDAMEDKQL